MRIHHLIIACILLCTAPLFAQINNYVEIQGPNIPGQSTSDKFKDQINVISYSFGVSRASPLTPGQPSNGPANLQDLSFTGLLDSKSLPKIIESSVFGTRHNKIILSSVNTVEGKEEAFLKIELDGATFTSVSLSGSSGDVPVYNFTVYYDKIKMTSILIDPKTGAPSGNVLFEFDREAVKN